MYLWEIYIEREKERERSYNVPQNNVNTVWFFSYEQCQAIIYILYIVHIYVKYILYITYI